MSMHSYGILLFQRTEGSLRFLLVHPGGVQEGWRREVSHHLQAGDLAGALEYSPDTVIVGRGSFGRMKVPAELVAEMAQQGVELIAARTSVAIKKYNEIRDQGCVVAALHLTC